MNKIITFLTLFLLSFSVFSQQVAINGENISTDKINSSVAQIGEIKQSILSLKQFQGLNGDCWVSMTGQTI